MFSVKDIRNPVTQVCVCWGERFSLCVCCCMCVPVCVGGGGRWGRGGCWFALRFMSHVNPLFGLRHSKPAWESRSSQNIVTLKKKRIKDILTIFNPVISKVFNDSTKIRQPLLWLTGHLPAHTVDCDVVLPVHLRISIQSQFSWHRASNQFRATKPPGDAVLKRFTSLRYRLCR